MSVAALGTGWINVDNDGRLDILTVNGAVQTIQTLAQAHDPFPLWQRKRLFHNLGGGAFEDATARGGAVLELSDVSGGAAFGDIDNDVVGATTTARVRVRWPGDRVDEWRDVPIDGYTTLKEGSANAK